MFSAAFLPASAEDIAIDQTNFPDDNFRAYLLSQPYGEDNVLTDEELSGITELILSEKKIKSLQGIEFFTSLTRLECGQNKLTALDVSKNTALKFLDCSENKLTALDVTANTALYAFYCYGNQLTELDVSKNTNLYWFECGQNQLTALDVSKNITLAGLQCYTNKITSIDVSQNTALYWLDVNYNQLTTIDVTKNTGLERLYCYGNQLTELNIAQNTALQYLGCGQNPLGTLDLSQNTALQWVDCYLSQLTALDLTANTALRELDINRNQIKKAEMDALIASLPTVEEGMLYVNYFQDEGNIFLADNIAAAKQKGWNPLFMKRGMSSWSVMEDYETPQELLRKAEVEGTTYSLYRQLADLYDRRYDSDNGFTCRYILTLDVEREGTTQSYPLDEPYLCIGDRLNELPCMMFDMEERQLYIFTHSKDTYIDYGFDGYCYITPLDDISFKRETVFTRNNGGWFPAFMGKRNNHPVISAFSYSGYYDWTYTRTAEGRWTEASNMNARDSEYYVLWLNQKTTLIYGEDYGPTESQYQAALESIKAKTKYRISTTFETSEGPQKYYLTRRGVLTPDINEGGLFTFTQTKGSGLYVSPGWKLNVSFSNPVLSPERGGNMVIQGHLHTYTEIRNDWEGKVLYRRGDNYAVRSTNTPSILYGADAYWAVRDDDYDGIPEAGYAWEPTYVWQLEDTTNDGINSPAVTDASTLHSTASYTLSGQRINGTLLKKGIYIVGGKKVVR